MNSVSFKTILARVKSKHASIEMKRARVETMRARVEMKRAMIKLSPSATPATVAALRALMICDTTFRGSVRRENVGYGSGG